MKSIRINLNINLSGFSEKEIAQIKQQLKKRKFPNTLEQFREEIDSVQKSYNDKIKEFKKVRLSLPSVDEFKHLIKKTDSDNFLSVFDIFIEEKKIDFEDTPSSLKDYISFKRSIIDYETHNSTSLSIPNLNRDFVRDYIQFLKTPREKNYLTKGNLSGKTIRKRTDVLKYFFKWYSNRTEKYTQYNLIKSVIEQHKFNIKDSKKITFSTEQISFLKSLNLTENTPFGKVRDMFLVVLQTGMRFSDLITLSKEHIIQINGTYHIRRKAIKTKDKVYTVEISEDLYNIITKYNFNLNLLSNQKANFYLKQLLSEYDIFRNNTQYKNGNTMYKFFELATFHQARRSFITNLLDNNFSLVEVMSRTDHKKISTLEKYVTPKDVGAHNILHLWNK
jgi:integrase